MFCSNTDKQTDKVNYLLGAHWKKGIYQKNLADYLKYQMRKSIIENLIPVYLTYNSDYSTLNIYVLTFSS